MSLMAPSGLFASSRASSTLSLGGNACARTPIRVHARCLRPDIEYKTLGVGKEDTCRDVVTALLTKYRMLGHRDPNLFYLTMDVGVDRASAVGKTLDLEDDARPAELKSCHPWGDCRFTLQVSYTL